LLRQREDASPEPVSESIGEAFAILKERGFAREQMSALLEELSIELVLTAHPTRRVEPYFEDGTHHTTPQPAQSKFAFSARTG
jgi:hypothetical protein